MKGKPKEQAFRLRVLAEDVAQGRLFEEPSYLSNEQKEEIARKLDIWSSAMVRFCSFVSTRALVASSSPDVHSPSPLPPPGSLLRPTPRSRFEEGGGSPTREGRQTEDEEA